jgi:two-component system, chemotaxis family, protein-glutamate methylesterase/glutaminase
MTGLRVLLCDDSRAYAAALRRMLEHDGDITVVAVCATAEQAVAALPRIKPDLVTMDLELPGMDGLDAVGEIMGSWPTPILVLSGLVNPRADRAAAALAAGALDAVGKDDLDLREPAGAAAAAFRQRVRTLSRARVIRHPRARLGVRSAASGPAHRASVIGICASAGGPALLVLLLDALPADYPVPILIVQHMAAGFTDGLIRWLDQTVRIPVRVAAAGMRAAAGAWVAPEGTHLKIEPAGRLVHDRHTVAGLHRPSGDVLLGSIAAAAGRTGVAVVLSGMGSDGAAGAAAVRRSGGLAIAQDEQSSAVFGMPKAAIDLGIEVVLPPAQIASCLLALHHQPFSGVRG